MSSTQQFVGTLKTPVARIITANTNRDGSGTIATLYTAGAAGARIDDISIKAESTTTLGMIRFFKSVDNGTTWRLIREVNVTAVTPSGTAQSFEALIADWALILGAGTAGNTNLLGVATNNAEAFVVSVSRGGDM